MSTLAEDLRTLAGLLETEPAVADTLGKSSAGNHFCWTAQNYGDVFNAVRKIAPVKVRVQSDVVREHRPMVFDAKIGRLLLTVLKARS